MSLDSGRGQVMAMTMTSGSGDVESLLAIEHEIAVRVADDEIENAHKAVLDACTADSANRCTVLESSVVQGEYGGGRLRARILPKGVEPLVALAARYGEVLRRTTEAEDLARPIQDTDKRVAMLEAYLEDLTRLRQQSRHEVEALIRVASEIAKTQAELDSARTEQKQLHQRVDMQILTIDFNSERHMTFSAPIRASLSEFRMDLGSGIALAISGIAFLLPWLAILFVLVWLIRRFWRRGR